MTTATVDFEKVRPIYNSRSHVDELRTGVEAIVGADEREEGVYYALIHKHYDLEEGEIIVASFDGDTHETRVEPLNDETKNYEPCMWYPHEGSYHAVMFSATKLKKPFKLPAKYRDDAGLIHPDYAYPWSEFTDTETRKQTFMMGYEDESATPIVTVVWKAPDTVAGCYANCYQDSGGTAPHQKGPHEKTRSNLPDLVAGCYANCYQDSGGTAPHQKGPHEKTRTNLPDSTLVS